MSMKMRSYAKGVNKPIPRAPRTFRDQPTIDFPRMGKVDPMRKIPLAGHKKGGK